MNKDHIDQIVSNLQDACDTGEIAGHYADEAILLIRELEPKADAYDKIHEFLYYDEEFKKYFPDTSMSGSDCVEFVRKQIPFKEPL